MSAGKSAVSFLGARRQSARIFGPPGAILGTQVEVLILLQGPKETEPWELELRLYGLARDFCAVSEWAGFPRGLCRYTLLEREKKA